MNEDLVQLWARYRAAVEALYVPEEGWVLDPGVEEGTFETVAQISEEFTAKLEELMPELPSEDRLFPLDRDESDGRPEYGRDTARNELEGAAFAVAGIDCILAATIFRESGGEQEARLGEAAPLLPPSPPATELPSMDFLLWKAGQSFGEGAPGPAGAQTAEQAALSQAFHAIDKLVERGAEPAVDYGVSMATLGAGELMGAVFEPLAHLVRHATGRFHWGSRLLRESIKKLGRVVGSEEYLKEHFEDLLESLHRRLPLSFKLLEEEAIGWLVRESVSGQEVVKHMSWQGRPVDLPALQAELDELHHTFSRHMWWAERIHDGLRVAAVGVAIVSLGVGHAALVAAYGVGFVVCLFTLADRLDTVPHRLGRVEGVPSIVARY